MGTMYRPACWALRWWPFCRNSMTGMKMPPMANPMVVMDMVPRVKFFMVKRSSGTRASVLRLVAVAWSRTKTTASANPTTRMGQIQMGHPRSGPCWMVNTMLLMVIMDTMTLRKSRRRASRGRSGTMSHTMMMDTIPNGTLIKKIHSQPMALTIIPPRMGPASDARPATTPHIPMAAPRRWRGKMRLMTLMVCGVMSDAPIP